MIKKNVLFFLFCYFKKHFFSSSYSDINNQNEPIFTNEEKLFFEHDITLNSNYLQFFHKFIKESILTKKLHFISEGKINDKDTFFNTSYKKIRTKSFYLEGFSFLILNWHPIGDEMEKLEINIPYEKNKTLYKEFIKKGDIFEESFINLNNVASLKLHDYGVFFIEKLQKENCVINLYLYISDSVLEKNIKNIFILKFKEVIFNDLKNLTLKKKSLNLLELFDLNKYKRKINLFLDESYCVKISKKNSNFFYFESVDTFSCGKDFLFTNTCFFPNKILRCNNLYIFDREERQEIKKKLLEIEVLNYVYLEEAASFFFTNLIFLKTDNLKAEVRCETYDISNWKIIKTEEEPFVIKIKELFLYDYAMYLLYVLKDCIFVLKNLSIVCKINIQTPISVITSQKFFFKLKTDYLLVSNNAINLVNLLLIDEYKARSFFQKMQNQQQTIMKKLEEKERNNQEFYDLNLDKMYGDSIKNIYIIEQKQVGNKTENVKKKGFGGNFKKIFKRKQSSSKEIQLRNESQNEQEQEQSNNNKKVVFVFDHIETAVIMNQEEITSKKKLFEAFKNSDLNFDIDFYLV